MTFKSLSIGIYASLALLTLNCAYAENTMQIKISNDTNQTIYPMITANNQQCVLSNQGINKGQSYTFNLKPECWNAGRVYLSDQPYQKNGDQPIEGRYQLAEYTFTDNGAPLIDYDFSAVDSLDSLPIAIEPIKTDGSSDIGFVGMNNKQSQETIEQEINEFTNATNWPHFNNLPSKIPGGYNLFAVNSFNHAKAEIIRNHIINNWFSWYNDKNYQMCFNNERSLNDCKAFEDSVKTVINAFKKNASYNHTPNPTQYQIIQHIFGFGPFNDPTKPPTTPADWTYITTDIGNRVIGLLRGVPTKGSSPNYLFPEYQSIYSLNPYVTFIHKKLAMEIYAFSIDDSIGNQQAPNYNGIQIDVGSTKSLPNPNPFTPPTPPVESKYHITPGGGWGVTTGTVCGKKVTYKTSAPAINVIFDQEKTCQVSLKNPDVSFELSKYKNGNINFDKDSCQGTICQAINITDTDIILPSR